MRQIRAKGSRLNRQLLLPAEPFIYSETISGALLLVCAIVALVWANSPWSHSYLAFRDTPVSIQSGTFLVALDLQHWINDGVMAVFFFVVTLEIKREMISGDLSDTRKAALPVVAAVGGMAMAAAIAILGLMLAMRWVGFRSTLAYVFPAMIFWAAMLKSGVHATIAGVILGAITPAKSAGLKSTFVEAVSEILPEVRDSLDREDSERNDVVLGRIEELARQTESPLERLERMVHPWTSYLILPLFALVNAGVVFSAESLRQAFTSAVTLGVVLGLVVGKVVGVTGFAWLAVRLGWATLPGGVGWGHITGAGLIGGVGFTVSLFITGLAFSETRLIEEAKVGVLTASLIAALGGYFLLLLVSRGSEPSNHAGGRIFR